MAMVGEFTSQVPSDPTGSGDNDSHPPDDREVAGGEASPSPQIAGKKQYHEKNLQPSGNHQEGQQPLAGARDGQEVAGGAAPS